MADKKGSLIRCKNNKNKIININFFRKDRLLSIGTSFRK